MAELITKKGYKILLDEDDYSKLKHFTWGVSSQGYAVNYQWSPKRKAVLMHRVILNPQGKMQVDHINRNKLDNRKSNLRLVTAAQNVQNTSKRSSNKLGIKHICYDKFNKVYKVQIIVNGVKVFHKNFKDLSLAIKARDFAIKKYNQEYGGF